MVLENMHGKLICPENRLDCTKADIELLHSKLPPKENCIIKDFESHNGDLFFDYKGSDGTEFAIEWDPETQSFYASPIELVKNLIQSDQDGEITSETTDTPVEPLVELFREKYAQFVSEMGRAPKVLEIAFESGDDVLRIRRNISGMAEAATEPVQTEVPIGSVEDNFTDESNEDEKSSNEMVIKPQTYAMIALKLMAGIKTQEDLAEEVGVIRATISKFVKGDSVRMRKSSVTKLHKWLVANSSVILKTLQDEVIVIKTLVSPAEKEMLKGYLTNSNPEEAKPTVNQAIESLKFDFRHGIGIAAIKLACGVSTKETIADEIGICDSNIIRYTSASTQRFNKITSERIQKWLFNNMQRLWQLLQDNSVNNVLTSEEATILDEFLYEHLQKPSN